MTDDRNYDGLGIMSDIYLWKCSGQVGLIDLICRSAKKHLFITMTKSLLFFIGLLVSFKCAGQQQVPLNEKHYLDSLQQTLQRKIPDSSRANTNFQLVEYWKFKDTVKSKAYLEAGTVAAKNDRYLNALVLFYKGQYYFNWDKPKASSAFKKAEEALSHFSTKKAYAKRAAAWYNYALMNVDKMGYGFITKITLEKAIPIAEKTGDPARIAYYYSQLATILMNNYQFSKATSYNKRAIVLLESKDPGSTDLLFSYLTGVSIYCYDNKADKARVAGGSLPSSSLAKWKRSSSLGLPELCLKGKSSKGSGLQGTFTTASAVCYRELRLGFRAGQIPSPAFQTIKTCTALSVSWIPQ